MTRGQTLLLLPRLLGQLLFICPFFCDELICHVFLKKLVQPSISTTF
uniref:Uncharacterized protein n=1 Tax=Arundo donax TaxID=35708 RepID=A0A0A8Y2G2_ARUDO